VASAVSEQLLIQSHCGPYTVHFDDARVPDPALLLTGDPHFLIDANVARLYQRDLGGILDRPSTIVIEATESNKSLANTIPIFEHLVSARVRRDHTLVAIGGGIIQDITCFIAGTLLRGLSWQFVPTTLLAQADSCIGSKSSINLGATKNVLGTFNPPRDVFIHAGFLDTLETQDIQSGIGEIIKVHAIDGRAAFDRLAHDHDRLLEDRALLLRYVRDALRIKQRFIEQDEFDRGIRRIFNYGHSFGHAIESATNFRVPHGIAVTIGMDTANYVASRRGLLPIEQYHRMHPVLRLNYQEYAATPIPIEALMSALMRDKKNTTAALGLILPVGDNAVIEPVAVVPDETFRNQCEEFFAGLGG
jgi:3-dehydroquinate synthase